jgi:hypothetical protein
MKKLRLLSNISGCLLLVSIPSIANAVLIGGVEFPEGIASFADSVLSYDPVISSGPTEPHRIPENALGIPDYTGDSDCTGNATCAFVSLGDGGSITLQFTDNLLTGSGDASDDLWIFEVGPDVEDTFVDISWDNITWHSVGSVGGSTAGVDIDAFGFGITDLFRYVRLTDDGDKDDQTGRTVGADIDAVGAISTTVIPVPAGFYLFGSGLLGLVGIARRKKAA